MFQPDKLKDFVEGRVPEKVELEPFTLPHLIQWLRTKPADEEYNYWNCNGECLLSQYVLDCGAKCFVYARYLKNIDFDLYVAFPAPHTFGAALSRALALSHSTGEEWMDRDAYEAAAVAVFISPQLAEYARRAQHQHSQPDLPCPFCGSGVTLPRRTSFGNRYFVQCSNEECAACPSVEGRTGEEALTLWNDRPPIAARSE